MNVPKKLLLGALVAGLYLICAYAAQSGAVPMHMRYLLSGCLFGFWPLVFIALTLYALYSAWKTRQRDSILLFITSLFISFWMVPVMLRMSYYSFQAASAAQSAPTKSTRTAAAEQTTEPTASATEIEEIQSETALKQHIAASTEYPLVVKIFATWCGPCQQMVPNFKSVVAELQNKITFVEINFDVFDNKDALNIKGLPTIICYKNGKEAFRIGGFRTREQLHDEISKLL